MTNDGRKSQTDDNWQGIKRGQKLWHEERGGPFVVMAVVDGYVVMRRPSCMPFLESVRDVGRKWLTSPAPPKCTCNQGPHAAYCDVFLTPNVEAQGRAACGASPGAAGWAAMGYSQDTRTP